jgi:hypothetical protein
MTQWKNNHEKRTPFLARGNGRIRDLEDRVDELADKLGLWPIQLLTDLPQHPDDNTFYIIYEETADEPHADSHDNTPSP